MGIWNIKVSHECSHLKTKFPSQKGISYVDTDTKYVGMSGQPRASGFRDKTSLLTTTVTTNAIKNTPSMSIGKGSICKLL